MFFCEGKGSLLQLLQLLQSKTRFLESVGECLDGLSDSQLLYLEKTVADCSRGTNGSKLYKLRRYSLRTIACSKAVTTAQDTRDRGPTLAASVRTRKLSTQSVERVTLTRNVNNALETLAVKHSARFRDDFRSVVVGTREFRRQCAPSALARILLTGSLSRKHRVIKHL